tara:strand:+ start:166 stop:1425 length:1260 start_codon:yes stop_codon:yes gene_type:complete
MNDGSALTGTITTNTSSGTEMNVAGSGTAFTTEVAVGDVIVTAGSNSYRVKLITSNTALVLTENVSSAESGVSASVRRPPLDFSIAAPHIASDYLGVDATEKTSGKDNITSMSLDNPGTCHRTAPSVSIAAPAVRTIATSAVSTAANTITIASHGILTGTKLTYQDGSGTALAGLTDNTAYFAVVVDANTIKVASSLSNAQAGTTIALTGTGNNAQTLEGDTATATATVSAGKVTGVSITAVGSDYQSVPAVTIAAPATETLDLTDASVAVLADDEIVVSSGFYGAIATGDKVTYSKGSGGTAIAGVTEGEVFLIKSGTANKISLATSEYKATTGDKIDLTAVAAGGTAHTLIGVTPTATAVFGMGSSGQVGSGLNAHIGWVKKTVGTGGRAGRVTYETLVAGSSISGDASDDLNAPDS